MNIGEVETMYFYIMKFILTLVIIITAFRLSSQTYSDSLYQIFDSNFSRMYQEDDRLIPGEEKINLKDSIYTYAITIDDIKKITAISDILKMKKNEGIYSYEAIFFVKSKGLQLYLDEGQNVLLTYTLLDCVKRAGSGSLFILSKIHFEGDGISENNAPIVIKVL